VVQSVLDFLPAPYGDVLEWKYVDGLSVAEVALRLGRSVKATESLLTRAREAFRSAVEELFAENADLVRP
jgi:RNA polymerase sigma-70 factor (ECF subfamily)